MDYQIYLRPMAEEDAELIVEWRNKPELKRFFISQTDFTIEGHLKWFRTMKESGRACQMMIIDKKDDKPLGSVDIKDIDPVVYKEYTGFDNKNVIDNLLRLRDKLKPEMLRIRVPRIRGYNTDEQVEKSVLWVRHNIKVEPEVFDYVV